MALIWDWLAKDKIIGALRDPGDITISVSPFLINRSVSKLTECLSDIMAQISTKMRRKHTGSQIIIGVDIFGLSIKM